LKYLPDFEINPELFIEIKGRLYKKDRKRMIKFRKMYPEITLIGVGDGDNKVYDIHILWAEKEKLISILKNN
jgi:hypothetical protein